MENLLKVHGLKMTQGAGWRFLPMEVCSPREGDSGRSSPRCSAGAVQCSEGGLQRVHRIRCAFVDTLGCYEKSKSWGFGSWAGWSCDDLNKGERREGLHRAILCLEEEEEEEEGCECLWLRWENLRGWNVEVNQSRLVLFRENSSALLFKGISRLFWGMSGR